jgi:hypothetical protein
LAAEGLWAGGGGASLVGLAAGSSGGGVGVAPVGSETGVSGGGVELAGAEESGTALEGEEHELFFFFSFRTGGT